MIAQLLRFALYNRFITVALGLMLIGLGIYSFRLLKLEARSEEHTSELQSQ